MIEAGFVIGFATWMTRREWASIGREKRVYQELLDRARLSPDEVCAIGLAAADRGDMAPPVSAHLREIDGRLVWTVADRVIGACTTVEVDDATGGVIAVRHHPGR